MGPKEKTVDSTGDVGLGSIELVQFKLNPGKNKCDRDKWGKMFSRKDEEIGVETGKYAVIKERANSFVKRRDYIICQGGNYEKKKSKEVCWSLIMK